MELYTSTSNIPLGWLVHNRWLSLPTPCGVLRRSPTQVPAAALAVPAEPDADRTTAPEIVSAEGTLDLVVQDGRRATVNGAVLSLC